MSKDGGFDACLYIMKKDVRYGVHIMHIECGQEMMQLNLIKHFKMFKIQYIFMHNLKANSMYILLFHLPNDLYNAAPMKLGNRSQCMHWLLE